MTGTATRRELFAAAPSAVLAVAAGAAFAQPPKTKISASEWVEGMAWLHPNGRSAALNAIAAGCNPDDLIMIGLTGRGDRAPALTFQDDAGRLLSVGPNWVGV